MTLLQANSGFSTPAALILLTIIVLIYFLPGLIGRKKNDAASIALLNLFLGWTLIGWVIALIWALSPDKSPVVIYNQIVDSKSDEIAKFKKLLDEGAITQDEYENKNRIF